MLLALYVLLLAFFTRTEQKECWQVHDIREMVVMLESTSASHSATLALLVVLII